MSPLKSQIHEWSRDFIEMGTELVEFVSANAEKNSPQSVLNCLDKFNSERNNMSIGKTKGDALSTWIRDVNPKYAIELGTFLGYSAVTLAKQLPDGAILYSVDFYEESSKIAQQIAEIAGLSNKIKFMTGVAEEVIEELKQEQEKIKFDFVLLDHSKPSYVPDLKKLVNGDMLNIGCVIAADNCLIPGAPEYLEWVRSVDFLKTESIKIENMRADLDIVERSVYIGRIV